MVLARFGICNESVPGSSPSNNHHSVVGRGLGRNINLSAASLDILLFAPDIDCAILLFNIERVQGGRGGGVFYVTGFDIEACCLSRLAIAGHEEKGCHVPPCHGHVSRPSGVSTPFFRGAP